MDCIEKPVINKDLKVFMNYRRLKEIKRCNNFPVNTSEDVAQHSYYVTLIAMILADEYNTWMADYEFSGNKEKENSVNIQYVKIEQLLRKSLVHDLEEVFTSDIPWNIKHMNEEVHQSISAAINQRLDKAYEKCKTMELYLSLGKHCKDGFEGQFVEIADTLELAIYTWEEISKGNIFLKSLMHKCLVIISSYPLYNELMRASSFFKRLWELLLEEPSNIENLLDID